MNELQLKSKYEELISQLNEFGNEINHIVIEHARSTWLLEDKLFFRIPPQVRVKETDSFVQKACYRNKNYKNPLIEITDKVGIRYIVLVESQVDIVCKFIESCDSSFDVRRIRNSGIASLEHPNVYGYKSEHFEVRPLQGSTFFDGGSGIYCCEIQIRTLAQHAWSELSHFTSYKPKTKDSQDSMNERFLSRASALLESTDELFSRVYESAYKTSTFSIQLFQEASKHFGIPDSEVNYTWLDKAYDESIIHEAFEKTDLASFREFIVNKSYLMKRAKETTYFELNTPSTLILAYLCYSKLSQMENLIAKKWPFDIRAAKELFSWLALSVERLPS